MQALPAIVDWLWNQPLGPDPAVAAACRELLLDTLGCAIAGSAEPEVAALFRLGADSDPGPLRFPGLTWGLSQAGLTQGVAAAACWHEACEGLAAAHGRPGLHAVCAVLAPALAGRRSLQEVLEAVAAGFEVGGRLGEACRIRPGMHVDGTWGSFAAAVSVARLRGTTAAVALQALDHAACHLPFSLYWPITHGSTARNGFVGHGAVHGAASVTAAQAGLGGPAGSVGQWARVALELETLPELRPVGERMLLAGYLKPFPAVRHVHYGVAAARAWAGTGRDPAAIEAVTLRVYPEALTYCGNRAPATAIQAQFSLSYGLAYALAHGTLEPAAYSAECLADPAIRRLEALVRLEADPVPPAENRRGCLLSVCSGGTWWEHRVDHVAGDPGHRMTRGEVEAKFQAYAAPVLGGRWARGIADLVLRGDGRARFTLDEAGC